MRVAIVTGAAQGIGRRTAEVLGEAGYTLLLLDVQPCEATLSALRGVDRMKNFQIHSGRRGQGVARHGQECDSERSRRRRPCLYGAA